MSKFKCLDGTSFTDDITLITEEILDSYKEAYTYAINHYAKRFNISNEESREYVICVEEYAELPNGKYEKFIHSDTDPLVPVACWYTYNTLKLKKYAIFEFNDPMIIKRIRASE